MHFEIERKFLVAGDYKSSAISSLHISQGYLASSPMSTVRVRIYGDKGFLTVKGKTGESGMSRFEWEKEISVDEACELMALCGPELIDKTRYLVPVGGHVYEVDEFHGANEGLVVAEIELSSEDEPFEKPSWLGEEVTGDRKYYNSALLKHPFCTW